MPNIFRPEPKAIIGDYGCLESPFLLETASEDAPVQIVAHLFSRLLLAFVLGCRINVFDKLES